MFFEVLKLSKFFKHFLSRFRDPSYLEYLDKIGQNFFGLAPPARPRPGGMFSGIFDSLLNVLGEEEETGTVNRRSRGPGPSSSRRMETEDVE